jgi:hypothetical protein
MIATSHLSITMPHMIATTIQPLFLGLLFSLGFAACAPVKGYPGPARSDSEVVQIRLNPSWTNIYLIVQSVDGMPVDAEVDLAVLPGSRTLGLSLSPYSLQYIQSGANTFTARADWHNSQSQEKTSITYDFALGTTYAFSGKSQTGLYTLWVQEDQHDAKKLKTWELSVMPAE